MAFEGLNTRLQSIGDATQVMMRFRAVHAALTTLDAMVTRYTDGSDPDYTQALDFALTAEERGVLATMIEQSRNLQGTWEANAAIREALGLPPL